MFKLACTIGEYLMIYLFSGSIIELIKETTISGFIEGVPEPTQDGIGSRYEDEPEEEETEGKEEEEEDIIETEDVDIMDLELEGPSAFVEFIDHNQKDIGFGDQDFDEAARSLGMEYDEDTFNAQEEIRLRRLRRRQSTISQAYAELHRQSISKGNQKEVYDTWDHYKAHCERPMKYREEEDQEEKASVVKNKIKQFFSSVLAFFARNFYNFKAAALLLSFFMNAILLSYKWEVVDEDGDEDAIGDMFCNPGIDDCDAAASGILSGIVDDDGDGGDEDDPESVLVFAEWIPDNIEDIIHVASIIHSILSVSKARFQIDAFFRLDDLSDRSNNLKTKISLLHTIN